MKFGQLEQRKDEICNTYLHTHLSIRQMAAQMNCSSSGIKRILRKYHIPMRNKCASLNLCPHKFVDTEIQIIIGSLLGDGALTPPRGPNGESQFYEGHGPKQLSYLQWKYDELKRFIGCKIYPLNHTLDNGKTYKTYNFLTRKSVLFTDLRRKFYSSLMKRSDKKLDWSIIAKWMSPLTLAVWLMDDGTRSSKNRFGIECQSFSKPDNEFLVNLLGEKFNLDCKLITSVNGTGWKIQIIDNNVNQLRILLMPYFCDCLKYKLRDFSDNPVETQRCHSGVLKLKCFNANTPSPVDCNSKCNVYTKVTSTLNKQVMV